MKTCLKCPKPTEAERYEFCYKCWWDQDPRNMANKPNSTVTYAEIRHMREALSACYEFLKGRSAESLTSLGHKVGHAIGKDFRSDK